MRKATLDGFGKAELPYFSSYANDDVFWASEWKQHVAEENAGYQDRVESAGKRLEDFEALPLDKQLDLVLEGPASTIIYDQLVSLEKLLQTYDPLAMIGVSEEEQIRRRNKKHYELYIRLIERRVANYRQQSLETKVNWLLDYRPSKQGRLL